MRRSREIACRFELDPQDCDRLITTIVRSGAAPTQKKKHVSICFDTRDAAIANRGLAFGIRHEGEIASRVVQAVQGKAVEKSSPMAKDWMPFVEPLSAATPFQSRRWLQSFLRRKQAKSALFRMESQINAWAVDSSDVEISLDRLLIAAGRKQGSLAIVTFTCRSDTAEFFRLIAEICASAKLRLSAESAALRGYRLFGALRPAPVCAFTPKLATDMEIEQTFKAIARACFDQFLLNEAVIRSTGDREAVHQCRVALRRLSSCLRFFSSIVSGPGLDALRPDVKLLARRLQKARDLDVLIGEVFAVSVSPGDLIEIVKKRRRSAYDTLIAALSSHETANLFARLVIWIEAGDWTGDPARAAARKEKIGAFLERKLANATQKFKDHGAALERADEEERHKIRIRAKNLRYSAEFFECLIAPRKDKHKAAHRRFHAFVGALKDLQAILGEENDAHMGRRFLAELAQEMGQDRKAKKATLTAIAALGGRIGRLAEPEIRRKASQTFAEIKPFWGRIVAQNGLPKN